MSKDTNNSKKDFNARGFTIVELLIVIALIGILSAALVNIVNVRKQQDYANDGVRRQNLMDLVHAVETYSSAERSYPDEGAGNNPLTGTDSSVASHYIGLWPSGFIYNEDGSDFSIHIQMATSTTDYFKYSSTWQEIKECGPVGIDTVDTCAAL